MTPLHTKKIITFKITLKKYTYKPENALMILFNTKNITFKITLKSIPAKLTHFYQSLPNIHIAPFRIKNNF